MLITTMWSSRKPNAPVSVMVFWLPFYVFVELGSCHDTTAGEAVMVCAGQ
jgi:hypothetical protein